MGQMATQTPPEVAPTAGLPVVDIFCDESCHLQRDGHSSMSLGAISVAHESVRSVSTALRALKHHHGFSDDFELKWSKVSPAKLDFYLSIVDYFFNEPSLSFRGLVATHKERLEVAEAYQIPHGAVRRLATRAEQTNSHRLVLSPKVCRDGECRDITDKIRGADSERARR